MRRNSLIWKLVLSFMLVSLLSAALVAVFIRLTSSSRLYQFVIDQQKSELKTSLVDYYTTKGSWDGIATAWTQIESELPHPTPPANGAAPAGNPQPFSNQSPSEFRRRLFGLSDAQGNVLVSVSPAFPLGSRVDPAVLQAGTPIQVNGVQVGTILTVPQQPNFTPEENLFLSRTTDALLYATLTALVAALIVGMILARNLIRPLQALTQAAENMAQGDLDQKVMVNSNDEIGQLAKTFNWMSQEVSHGNQLRRQMTADIAHDLRTPLTVIAGYIESMQDGVLAPTPQRLALIYTEIERLQNLVTDLRTLSLADAGELPLNRQPIPPKYLLERAQALFEHQAEQQKVALRIETDGNLPQFCMDEARMVQVLGNLISNSLRYTPEGGEIVLSAKPVKDGVEIAVRDNGSGIDADQLSHIFERFYRADKSRYSDSNSSEESGLGLAIVKALVEAQDGTIRAESAPGQGTTIIIRFQSKPSLVYKG
ncbi:MAG TPA: ATP-binding protein [Anaerolineaceae bacterium]|nr:ATP-binding protein [Anaerolineaceae bacterium]